MNALTRREWHWLTVALEAGYDNGFTARPCPALHSLRKRGLVEVNPTTRGLHTQWRITSKCDLEYELRAVAS